MCSCVCVCESFVLASFSMLFWFVWQQLGRDLVGPPIWLSYDKVITENSLPLSLSLSLCLSLSPLSMLDFRLSPYSLYMTGLPALILSPLAG